MSTASQMNREPGGGGGRSRVKVVQMFTVEVNWEGKTWMGGEGRGMKGVRRKRCRHPLSYSKAENGLRALPG